MNDDRTGFEDRLTAALRSAGADAPEAAGLAPAARVRARARRRRTALTSVAASVAVAGLVVGVAAMVSRDDSGPTPLADGASETTAGPDTPVSDSRVESWRDLSVVVPADWGHGFLDDWCGDGGSLDRPVVQRPEGASIDILCDPQQGYGVYFWVAAAADLAYQPGEVWQYERGDTALYPDGAWLGYERGAEDNTVTVVAPDRTTAEEILATFVHNTSVDANGCPAHATETGPDLAEGLVRLCRYGLDDWLEQSELLTGKDAADAVAALEAAPAKGDRMCTMEVTGPTISVTSAEGQGSVVGLSACQGFTWLGEAHELTADVLYWVLSPGWSGGVEGDVPMPQRFRR